MRGTPRYEAGSRFKYTPDVIDFTYQNLVDAIADAIDQQMQEEGTDKFTTERVNVYASNNQLDFDVLKAKFDTLINQIIENHTEEEMGSYWQPRITQITDKYLGKGHKVGNMNRDQVEALSLIVDDLEELINNVRS